jgi:hypothetical protein
MNYRYVLFTLFILFGTHIFAQSHKAIGLTFLDRSFPTKCRLCTPKTSEELQQDAYLKSYIRDVKCYVCKDEEFASYMNSLKALADTSVVLGKFGKAQLYYRMVFELQQYDGIYNGGIFDLDAYLRRDDPKRSKPFSDLNKEQVFNGVMLLYQLFEDAKRFTDDEGKLYLDYVFLETLAKTGFLEYIYDFAERHYKDSLDIEYFSSYRFKDLDKFMRHDAISVFPSEVQRHLQFAKDAHQRTGYNPYTTHKLLSPGFNYRMGHRPQIGGEIALEIANLRNPYRLFQGMRSELYSRFAALYLGFNQEISNAQRREYYFGLARTSQLGFIYASVAQFGFKSGLDESKKARRFYRPESGVSFGNFQLFYTYTLLFNKALRSEIDQHNIHLRITFPYLRVSHYY